MKITEQVVGLTVEDAITLLSEKGYDIRVMHEDGQAFVGTCDFRLDRVNVSVVKNIITAANIG